MLVLLVLRVRRLPASRSESREDGLEPAANGSAKQQSDTIVRGIRMAIEEAGGEISAFGLHWPTLDEDLSFTGILDGRYRRHQRPGDNG